MGEPVIVVVEQERTDPRIWRYGLADRCGTLGTDARRLRLEPSGSIEPDDPPGLEYATAILLIRGAGGRRRLERNVTARAFPGPVPTGAPDPPNPAVLAGWKRSTSGKAKAPGRDPAREGRAVAAATKSGRGVADHRPPVAVELEVVNFPDTPLVGRFGHRTA